MTIPTINRGIMISHNTYGDTITTQYNATIPAVKIKLSNGSWMNFTTAYEAIEWILDSLFEGRIDKEIIKEIDVMPIDSEENGNLTYIRGYEAFFARNVSKDCPLNESVIILSKMYSYYYNRYGFPYTISPLFGPLNNMNITLLNGSTIKITELHGITILVYLNGSDELSINEVITWLQGIKKELSSETRLNVVVIDITNTSDEKMLEQFKGLGVLLTNDDNTSLIPNIKGSYKIFGFENVYPTMIYLLDNYIWRKSIGIESSHASFIYISQVLEKGLLGLGIYPILNITGWDLIELSPGYLGVYVGEGFGTATVFLSYKILDQENNTLKLGDFEENISYPGIYRFRIDLIPNNSRIIIIQAHIDSKFGKFSLKEVSLKVKYEVKEEETKEKPWRLWIGILLVTMIILVLGVTAARYMSEKEHKRRKKRR